MTQLPRTLEELTPEWLTAALRSNRVIADDASVDAVTWDRLGEGVGFIGIVGRGHVSYQPSGAAAPTLIAKLPSPDEGARTLGNLYGLYQREVRFYENLSERAGVAVPRCYFRTWDADAGQSVILLEDLAETGTPGDQVAGCGRDEALLAITALAEFHAAWSDEEQRSTIPWLENGVDLVRASMTQVYPAVWPKCLEAFGSLMDARVAAVVPDLHQRILRLMDENLDEAPMVIGHGDYRLDNLYFGGDGARYRVAVYDWQSLNRAWGAYDIAYFMAGSFPPEQRRAYEDQMLRAYHATFTRKGAPYEFDRFYDDYRRSLLVYLALFVVNGGTLELSNERAVELFRVIFDRLNAAIVDLDALALLPAP